MNEISIGRYDDNTVVFADDLKVSGHHCRCYEDNGKFYIVDTHSTNGVYVDGCKIEDATEISAESQIRVASHLFLGEELIKKIQKEGDSALLNRCKLIEEKYIGLGKRYDNNIRMFCDALHIEVLPYKRVFPSVDEEMKCIIEEYEKSLANALSILKLISKSSQKDMISFHEDMEEMVSICIKVPEKFKSTCQDIRMQVYNNMHKMQKKMSQDISEALNQFTSHYQSTFSDYYETAMVQDKKWQKILNNQIISGAYLLYGIQTIEYPFFEQIATVSRLQFVPFLKRNNILVRYNTAKSNDAQNIVNNILGRLFASSKSGNIQLHMMDPKDLGGTSNTLKMLDNHVYSICGRSSDVTTELAQLDRYVEDVVQNLLFGPYSTLEQYNQGKEKQEPYHVVVFKDFPFGITQENAHTIQRILANSNKAGIHFIFMLNEDYILQNEECKKIDTILHMGTSEELFAKTILLTEQDTDDNILLNYAILDDRILHDIVLQVNAGFEVKKDEILRLTDYIIPKEEWWTKQSASRADIPFGMASNKQIQKLNITQESGQNSAIVIGIPGSGKSVFLHVLIANAMINYSPRELQMYLLDFSGVEFDVYARHHLPHARVIAPEAEREFGLSILREVFEEGTRRMALCRENGVTNIVELKQKNPDLVVPRLLVIIDEFQKIFEIENDKISQEANAKIHAIIQEYRKFGINLILATQKLPAKSIVPYDLIANRVVFKSDPNDFNNLIHWPRSMPQPRLLTGSCVYNNESGAEFSNYSTRSFFIKVAGDLENLIDEVAVFAQEHSEMMDNHELRTFRSNDLPDFRERILAERHTGHQYIPREVGIYMGESIAIAPTHVYAPLTTDSNNNILIIGGQSEVAKGVAYYALNSEVLAHTEKACNVFLSNFMMDDDPMQNVFKTEMFSLVSDYCIIEELRTAEQVQENLQFIKDEVIDVRKANPSEPLTHFFINIFDFQRGRMFDGVGNRGDMQSPCAQLLEYILKNGPMVGVFTILQVDNLANLNRLAYNAQNLFCHRIALQMSEQDSDKVIGSQAANKLLVLNRPATRYRGLYYNHINNSLTKFKPYYHGTTINSQQ